MRYLNKIIFINSAHVPYAEIRLDGNVHFIGTQGVGKSTLLRAILFFYNVDKGKLGIRTQAGQKGYDDFYLPYPNSYIIYEVVRETGNFFVMTFLSRGRTAFRIVDCAYDKRYFLEDDGNVRYEWGKISELIGTRVFKSNIIRGYEEFRDILYGNHSQVDRTLRRFSLLESTKYQNVPRTIQNIFLNQSLESRVIKDTIIDSMDFASDGIDLNRYREHVKNFRQQYEDIWKWYKREKNGKVKVQTEAELVISRYMLYEETRRIITELCGNLNFALDRDTNRLPLLAKQEDVCSQELSRQRRLLSEEEEKHRSEFAKLNQEEGELNSFFKKLKEKRIHYQQIGIEDIAKRIEKEGVLNIQLESLRHQEETLTDKNKDITSRYNGLMQAEDHQLREYKLQMQQKLNLLDQEQNATIAKIQQELSEKQECVRNDCKNQLDENQKQTDSVCQEQSELRQKRIKLLSMNPFQEAMDELTKKISDLKNRKEELYRSSVSKQQEIDKITNEVNLQRKDLENDCAQDVARIENEIKGVEAEVQKCDDLLSRQKGSLIEWLGENVSGWEQNIGKVLDEEAVLYNTALNPQLSSASDSIYGVKVNLDNIDKTIKTPEEVQSQRANLLHKIEELKEQIAKRRQILEADIKELEQNPSARIKALRMEKIKVDAELNQIPQRITALQKEHDTKSEELQAWRKREQDIIDRALREIEQTLEDLSSHKKQLQAQEEKMLEQLRKEYARQKKEAEDSINEKKQEISRDIRQKENETIQRKAELQARMDAELKGLGVDVNQLSALREQRHNVKNELKFIEDHRPDFISWQNDIRDYFNHEQEKKEQRKQAKQKIDELQQKFDARKERLDKAIRQLSADLRAIQDEQKRLSEAISKVKAFMGNPSCPQELSSVTSVETMKPLSEILESLRDNISSQQRKMEEFKQAVIAFKQNFSAQNTFHFRTEFNTDGDYTEFAAELNDFLCNKKIEEYRVRTSSQYATIIKRIAKEVSDISQHGADIRATINDINNDFRENNFAGVIKEIELRAVESNDRLMQQLLNIKRFDDENGFNIGQLNLFSDEDSLNHTNQKAVNLLMTLIDLMDAEQKRDCITLSDTFKLEFKVKENDNDTNWVEKLSNVGSDGTDILVKAMVNIMLINVFKRKISRRFGDFKLHCMMDEIGKLHPNNVEGILKFANVRNIWLINSSPTTYNAQAYRYTYALSKDERSNTVIKTLLTIR